MTDETEQPVVEEVKTAAEPTVDTTSARKEGDSIDDLLAEYEKKTKPPLSPPQTPATPPQIDPGEFQAMRQRFFETDLKSSVNSIFDGIKVNERIARGWVEVMAQENPAIAKAFQNRMVNPGEWKRWERALSKEASKEFKSDIDEKTTADTVAVAAAVRGAPTKAPAEQAPDYSRMDNAQYREKVQKDFGFDPI